MPNPDRNEAYGDLHEEAVYLIGWLLMTRQQDVKRALFCVEASTL